MWLPHRVGFELLFRVDVHLSYSDTGRQNKLRQNESSKINSSFILYFKNAVWKKIILVCADGNLFDRRSMGYLKKKKPLCHSIINKMLQSLANGCSARENKAMWLRRDGVTWPEVNFRYHPKVDSFLDAQLKVFYLLQSKPWCMFKALA